VRGVRRVRRVRGVLGVLGLLGGVPVQAQHALSVNDVMKRVERYVDAHGEKASIVVATERYEQTARGTGGGVAATRTLVSDFALVHADAIHGWLGFRDVREVDGQRVSDREDRLARVLMGSQGRLDEARRLFDESARYNVGAIQRNFNVPTTALFFFTSENRGRFKFSARTVAADGTWEIAYRETDRPTLIRTPDGESIPSAGTIWVEPQTGTIVRTRLEVDTIVGRASRGYKSQGHVDVVYQHVPALDMWLPASMEEAFVAARGEIREEVSGRAVYSDYRQFTTSGRIK
jgi:hypothetical protein